MAGVATLVLAAPLVLLVAVSAGLACAVIGKPLALAAGLGAAIMFVAEIKKGKYVYYHCTGHTNKGRGGYGDCRRKYVREEVLDQAFANLLDRLHFDEEIREWVKAALMASHADEHREHEQAIHRCQVEYKRLEDRLHAMYLDKLDGRIDNAFYDRMSAQWRIEQTRLLCEIERHGSAEESYMEDGIRLLELSRNARRLLAKQPVHEKKRLLNLVLSNCQWNQGEVHAIFRQPFDPLAETVAAGAAIGAQRGALSTGSPVWLGFLEAFRTFWVGPHPELRALIGQFGTLDPVFEKI
ncbi:zinc ribbon domain-containing protein [Mesorhizobium sp. BH1-1-5]|uniref:zinc ribbon domain-containing protein n=1 Tax=Mesorhizobium sp. BH1-1-5 TaxID=2876661 RepID=UPI001CCEC16B|nr:zinc ribbon domain-containing protein [Mesorhizobium sp. BH1-1-5]MBZ9987639.1 zinc ribbon domain-containing protein [Mesorhizobium sp. BH1-1-5]